MRRVLPLVLMILFAALMLLACGDAYESNCKTIPNTMTLPRETLKSYKIIIHPDVPAYKAGSILDAASEWSTSSGGAVLFESTFELFDPATVPPIGQIRVYIAPKSDPNSGAIGVCGWWNIDKTGRPGMSNIWILDELDLHTHYLVALHEFGHAIGVPHIEDPNVPTIMFPNITDPGEAPTCADRKKLCEIWGCQPNC